ncbi:MAG: hypothetical protein LBQ03_02185 [Puniceicoccales bacterium]|jgi:hypothetical protein|nr:hypothetical protein [Puniceicoccales bacterium]
MYKKHFLIHLTLFPLVSVTLFAGRHSKGHKAPVIIRRLRENNRADVYRILHAHKDQKRIHNQDGTWVHLNDDTWLNLYIKSTYTEPCIDPLKIIHKDNIRPLNYRTWLAIYQNIPFPSMDSNSELNQNSSDQEISQTSKQNVHPKLRHKLSIQ